MGGKQAAMGAVMIKKISVAALIAFTSVVFPDTGRAADEALVREYMGKAEFRSEFEAGIRGLGSIYGKGRAFSQLADNIDYKRIEDAYFRSMRDKLTNADIQALIKAAEIPGIRDAMKKQTQAVSSVAQIIVQEVEAAAKKAGMQIPGQ